MPEQQQLVNTNNPTARGLFIVIVLIYNPHAIVRFDQLADDGTHNRTSSLAAYASDPRLTVMEAVTEALRKRGHTVLLCPAKTDATTREAKRLSEHTGFEPYAYHRSPRPDLVITWWAYRWQKRIDVTRHPPVLQYENGFTRGDLLLDPGGLLGASAYVDSLNDLMRRGDGGDAYDDAKCTRFLEDRIASGAWSKRPQADVGLIDVPADIVGRYIFVPTQHMKDRSISLFSNMSMFALLKRVAKVATEVDAPVVVKIHPHIDDEEKNAQRRFIDATLRGAIGANVVESVAAIGYLTANARLTVTLNGGTIMDNFYTQSPVVTAARSMFFKTDAVIFDPDPARGIARALATEWDDVRKRAQRQAACWVARMSLNVDNAVDENLAVIQRHLDLTRPDVSIAPVADPAAALKNAAAWWAALHPKNATNSSETSVGVVVENATRELHIRPPA